MTVLRSVSALVWVAPILARVLAGRGDAAGDTPVRWAGPR
jgi:hypothetical protein